MAGKKKRTKWKKLSLGDITDENKEQSSEETCSPDSTSPPASVETEKEEIWTTQVPQQYYQSYPGYHMTAEGIVDLESAYQVAGQTYYPVYIPTLVPRIESSNYAEHHQLHQQQRLPSELHYYYGLTYPQQQYGGAYHSVITTIDDEYHQHGVDVTTDIVHHPVTSTTTYVTNTSPYVTNPSPYVNTSPYAIDGAAVVRTLPGLGFCSSSDNSHPANSYDRRKKKKKRVKRSIKTEYRTKPAAAAVCVAADHEANINKRCLSTEIGNSSSSPELAVNECDEAVVTESNTFQSTNYEVKSQSTTHKATEDGSNKDFVTSTVCDQVNNSSSAAGENYIQKSECNLPNMKEINGEPRCKQVDPDLQAFAEKLVQEVVESAQKICISSRNHCSASDLESWSNQLAIETIQLAKNDVVKSRVRKVSAIAERRGQNVLPITITKHKLRRSKKLGRGNPSPNSNQLQIHVPQVRSIDPTYVNDIVDGIINDAISVACASPGHMSSSKRRKSVKKQQRLEEEMDESPKLIDKLASILMYQILFDAQNEIVKMKKGTTQKAIVGEIPLIKTVYKVDNNVSNKVMNQSNNYQIAFDYEEYAEDSPPIEHQMKDVAYKDTVMQLRQEEELEVRISQMDEFRKNGDEIVVYEASEGSECGSEDVEILTHRYDTNVSENKHVFVNQLSLATEMLRTDQEIPYDAQFKPLLSPTDEQDVTSTSENVLEATNNSFILKKYYESLASSVRSNKKQKTAMDSGVHSDESDTEDLTEESSGRWWKFGRRFRKSPGEHFLAARDNPFPTGFCCSIM